MENEKKEQYRGTEEFLDVKALGALRGEFKFKEVYDICKEKYSKFPNSNFIASQYLIALIDYKPTESEEIKKISDKLLEGKSKYYANFGYVMYYLSINNINEAYKCFQVIRDDKFLVRKVVVNLNDYKCSKDFRNMILDVDRAIEEINQPDYPDKRYIFKTFDIAEHYYLEKNYQLALKYYSLSEEKRIPERKSLCFLMMGKCYYHLSNYEQFRAYFEKALEYSKKYNCEDNFNVYYKTLYQYIYYLIDFSDYQEAYELTSELEKGSKKDKLMAIFLRAKIFKHISQFDEAIKVFKSIMDKDKDERRFVLIELAKVYILLSDEENATKYINMLYTEYPDEGPTHKMAYYYDLMKNEECVDYCKKYLDTDYDTVARFYTGRSLCRLRRFDEAKPYFLEIEGKLRKPQIYFELGLINEKQGNSDDAYRYYCENVDMCYKKRDKKLLNKGLTTLIEYLNNQYEFELALQNISFYKSMNPEDTVQYNYLMAVYYYRKQDYDKSITYFKELYGTELENKAKHYLTIIYRYIGENGKANVLLDELSSTEYSSQATLNTAKQLKDRHTKQSLNEAYNLLLTIQDDDIKTITMLEKIKILIKLGKYDLADSILEKGYEQHSITTFEYRKYKPYILYKQGRSYDIDPKDRSIFINLSIKYDEPTALESVIRMNDANLNRKELYLSPSKLTDLFYEFKDKLNQYDYYTSELYDIYIVEMDDIIGNFFGIDTKYIEIKCEQNTTNIHTIQPTLKRVNLNKRSGKQRKRTDLDED